MARSPLNTTGRGGLVAMVAALACSGPSAARGETDVVVVALETEIRFLTGDTPSASVPTFCLLAETMPGPAALGEILARLQAGGAAVARGAECGVGATGVRHAGTGRAAVLLTLGAVEWTSPDEADVDISVLRKPGELTRRRYRVVHEGGRWVCLGQVLKLSPA